MSKSLNDVYLRYHSLDGQTLEEELAEISRPTRKKLQLQPMNRPKFWKRTGAAVQAIREQAPDLTADEAAYFIDKLELGYEREKESY